MVGIDDFFTPDPSRPEDGVTGYPFITFEYDVEVGIYSAELDRQAGPEVYDFRAKDRARVVGEVTLHLTAGTE